MLRSSLGVTRLDRVRNEQIRGTVTLEVEMLWTCEDGVG